MGERRVALVPEVISKLTAKGLDVVVQEGAGAQALLPDAAFLEAGATLSGDAAEVWGSDLVVTAVFEGREAARGILDYLGVV